MARKVKPGKTLPDLGAKVGSRVYFGEPSLGKRTDVWTISRIPDNQTDRWDTVEVGKVWPNNPYWHFADDDSQAEPVRWRDDTPENKGAVLLALHEGRPVEAWEQGRWWTAHRGETWIPPRDDIAYRVKPPAPPTAEIVVTSTGDVFAERVENLHLRRITLPLHTNGNAITGTFTDDAGNQIIIEDTSHD